MCVYIYVYKHIGITCVYNYIVVKAGLGLLGPVFHLFWSQMLELTTHDTGMVKQDTASKAEDTG